ncbi:alpha/beta hydrolase [Clostridium sp. DSM 100503]|uniref:alpha/beta hydrolase n=1 Tax=Clostridium sp. DSM 100503 TaxID=2963282 RepID=UPI00214A433A|nr:alpha/beta hydrolase [Clostridium sp. DSM 100503]MCR1951290.1 alpha/beta hydrolase [Clostridium sp. DSM 100503]
MLQVSEYILIRGLEQYILISGNEKKPVMLFLHGGPGTSQSGFIRKYQNKLEKEFLIVNWDQRGAGKSNIKKFSRDELTIENIVKDTECLIEVLLKRFNVKKIYLVGHSFGTIIGIRVVKRIPQYIEGFISIGQIVDINEGDKISYNYLSAITKEYNDKNIIRKLYKLGEPPYKNKLDINALEKIISKYKGDIFKLSKMKFILKSFSLEYYSMLDWIRFLIGMIRCKRFMYEELYSINLFQEIKEIKVPIYFCVGDNDYHTPAKLIEEYYRFIKAPKKNIYKFKCSAHMPNIEEVDTFYNMCKSIIKNK